MRHLFFFSNWGTQFFPQSRGKWAGEPDYMYLVCRIEVTFWKQIDKDLWVSGKTNEAKLSCG